MIRMFWTALLLAALVSPVLAGASITIFHDKAGRVTGSARTEDKRTTFYDPGGRVVGRAEKRMPAPAPDQ